TLSTFPVNGLKKGRFLDKEQIEEIRKARKPKKDPAYIGYQEAHKRFGFTRNQLYSWRDKGCCYLEGEKLRVRELLRSASNGAMDEIEVYELGQLEEIHRGMNKEQKGIFQDEEGTWLSAKAAKREYGLWEASLDEWRELGCPFLGDRKLRAKPFRRLNKRG